MRQGYKLLLPSVKSTVSDWVMRNSSHKTKLNNNNSRALQKDKNKLLVRFICLIINLIIAWPLFFLSSKANNLSTSQDLSLHISPLAFITCSDIKFAAKKDISAGSSSLPQSVAIGDINGDGLPDLATANSNPNTVSIFRNTSTNGSVSFATKVDFTTGGAPFSVAIGDLDGDGLPDLAVANFGSATVSVFRNTSTNGSVSFATKVDFTTGTNPKSVAIRDINGDSKPDLVVVNQTTNGTVSVLKNTSVSGTIDNNSFATKVDFNTGADPSSVAIGDLDGDGLLDLAVANITSNTVSVLKNTSVSGTIDNNSFATKVDFSTGDNSGPRSVVMGDLDGDGLPDLATSNLFGSTVSVLKNTSVSGTIDNNSFATKVDLSTGDNSGPRSVAIGDLDGDGLLDLATSNGGNNKASVFRNTSTNGSVSFATKQDFTTGTSPSSVAIGDLNNDGRLDLAVANNTSSTVSVLANICTMVAQTSTTTTVTSSPNSSTFGQTVTLTATVTQQSGTTTPTGMVQFFDGKTSLGTATLNTSAQASIMTSAIQAGSRSITAMYLGDTNYSASTSVAITQTVAKADTTTSLTSNANPSVFGQSVTFTATVSVVAPGSGTVTGMVQFKDGATALGSPVSLTSGQAQLSTNALSVATHSITAMYLGDTNFNTSASNTVNQVVNKANTSISIISSANPSNFNQSVTFTATVHANSPSSGIPSGTIQFMDGATNLGTPVSLNASGQAQITTSTLTGGSHSINAVYNGDTNFNTSTGTVTQVVNPVASTTTLIVTPNPSVFGQPVTLSATVTGIGGTPTGTVQFKDGATNLGSPVSLNASGSASMSVSTLSTGTHSLTAIYSGNNHFNSSTSTVSQVVNKANTTTTVTSSQNPSVFGQTVTFTATVSTVAPSSGTVTGMVQFMDGTNALGSPVNLTNGQAQFSTSALSVATHSITSVYNGDTNFNSSTSIAISQVINKANTSATLTANLNQIVPGQTVTFTATVSAVAPGAGIPGGSVQFNNGANSIGTATLNASGVATLSVALSNVGSNTITAVYSGNTNFNTNTSNSVTIFVGSVDHNTIYAADTLNNRIQRSTNNGQSWQIVGNGVGVGLGQFNAPKSVTANFADTVIFVADTGNNRIQRSTDGGSTWAVIATGGTAANQVNQPSGIAYDEINNKLYIADTANSRILVVTNPTSTSPSFAIFAGASAGTTVGKVNQPQSVAIDLNGKVYVADTANNRVQVNSNSLNTGWTLLATVGKVAGQVIMPKGVYVDNSGRIWVADTANNRIQVNISGVWSVFMSAGTTVGTVNRPEAMAVNLSSGNVFIADTGNNRIQSKPSAGGTATIVGQPGLNVGQFNQPSGIR